MNEERERELREREERLTELVRQFGVSCQQAAQAMQKFGELVAKMNLEPEPEQEEDTGPKTLFGGRPDRTIPAGAKFGEQKDQVIQFPKGMTENMAIQHIAESRCPFCLQSGLDRDLMSEKYYCTSCQAVFGPAGEGARYGKA